MGPLGPSGPPRCPVCNTPYQACKGAVDTIYPPVGAGLFPWEGSMDVTEYEVTQVNRRGEASVTTMLLSEADAAALGDAAVPVGEAPAPVDPSAPAKARRPANKAAGARTK